MKLYEMIFVAKNELAEEQVNSIATSFSDFVKGHGGEIKFEHYFGTRSLAYEIQKNKKGHYYLMHFLAEPSIIAELDRNIRLNESVIRHIIVNIEESNPDEVIAMLTIKDRDTDASDDDLLDEEIGSVAASVADTGYRQKVSGEADESEEDVKE